MERQLDKQFSPIETKYFLFSQEIEIGTVVSHDLGWKLEWFYSNPIIRGRLSVIQNIVKRKNPDVIWYYKEAGQFIKARTLN